jgi:hypothetical protein
MNPTKTFSPSNMALLSHVSAVGATYEEVTPYASARLNSTLSHSLPCGLSHAKRVAPSDMARLSHASSFSITGPPRGSHPFFSFFLLLSSPCSGSFMIYDFSPLFGVCGATNRLYELVSQSCWVHTSSLPSHFVVF